MNQSSYSKWIYAVSIIGACLLMPLAWLLMRGMLPTREFVIGGALWWIVMGGALFRVIRLRQRSIVEERKKQIAEGTPVSVIERERCEKNIRTMQLRMGFLVFFLLFNCFHRSTIYR